MSSAHLVTVLVAVTSLLAFAVGVRVFGLPAAGVRAAAACAIETVGFGFAFFAANVTIGLTAALLARAFVGFASLYPSNDLVLLLLSLFQGLVFSLWRRGGAR